MATPLFHGSIVALVTPMTHGEVDYQDLKKLVEYHIQAGSHAIVSVGTTGESTTLSIDENVKVIKKTVEFADGRIPIIAGTGSNATSEAITMTKLLAKQWCSWLFKCSALLQQANARGDVLTLQSDCRKYRFTTNSV